METTFQPGLENVVVAETDLSLVDGEGGRLVVRGHSIETLATRRFEDICGLLWDGALPAPPRAEAIRSGSRRDARRRIATSLPRCSKRTTRWRRCARGSQPSAPATSRPMPSTSA